VIEGWRTFGYAPPSGKSDADMARSHAEVFLEVLRGVRLSRRTRFRTVRAIKKPALVLYGENDEFCFGDVPRCVAILAAAIGAKANFEMGILAGAGHGFRGFEEELATLIVDWMRAL